MPPLLSIVSVPEYVFGIPLLYLYLFAAWAVVILLMALAIGAASSTDKSQQPGGDSALEDRSD